ncbi:type II secretion system protein [Pseudomonas sp. R5(2019)]|uniref:type II secretion system protein n=1 Tax=Pseudomonas sp. R5(2019) TaxID=2697566 RepID=UPI001412D3BB|nr:type II secretion system protein [Pseudomonas sp. R5(2019)]NBA96728.1 type II secretion system protein [Pseudomonas sp. R5(2019)]
MAAFTQSGNPAAMGGFTYLGVLLLIALSSMALAAAGQLWSTAAKRERERELIWVGSQYAQALRSYYRASPGLAQYPEDLAELLEDNRFPSPKRHLRRLYPDPISQTEDWGLVRSIDGRITGVYSRSQATPLKQSGFPAQWSDFEGVTHYADWQFVAEKAFMESATGGRKSLSQGGGE